MNTQCVDLELALNIALISAQQIFSGSLIVLCLAQSWILRKGRYEERRVEGNGSLWEKKGMKRRRTI